MPTKTRGAAGETERQRQTPEREAMAAAASAAAVSVDPPGTVVLDNGIVLKLKKVPPIALRDAVAQLEKPQPPQADIGKGRLETNFGDPAYNAAMEEYGLKTILAAGNVALLLGTECQSVPDGMYRPEDDDWIDFLDTAGVRGLDTSTKPKRYGAWLNYYAFTTEMDRASATFGAMSIGAISESEVANALASFRSAAARRPDRDGADTEQSQHGDPVPAAVSGNRPRNRGARSSKGSRVRVGKVAASKSA